MFSKLFIFRPKLALVISLVITIIGSIALGVMPIAEYPKISPQVIMVNTVYPGASADVVKETVAQPIESLVNGVEDMIYMSSNVGNDGSYRLKIYFRIGSDGDMAQVRVNNLVSQAMSSLPAEVKQIGVTVRKKSSDMLAVVALSSPNGTYNSSFLSNYADLKVSDRLKRVEGMSDVNILGSLDYSMRIWLNPEKLATLGLTSNDIATAIREQNIQVAAGTVGGNPSPDTQQFQYVLQTKGRLTAPEEFENIVIRANADGSLTKLKDVARINLGAERYEGAGFLNNQDAAVMALYQLPDANALETMERTREMLKKIGSEFPDDLEYTIAYNSTDYIKESINEIAHTLIEAGILVVLVVYLFLQNFRATLIPTIAIPVSIIGTFAVMQMMGMSINTISMFGLILAIGIVVDDAIIVVENVERLMHEEDMDPIPATIQAMKEVTGPVLATTLILLAVFVPVALLPGISGQMFNQFAVTICVSVLMSAVNALTLSPAMCALTLKKGHHEPIAPLRAFNAGFLKLTGGFTWLTRVLGSRKLLSSGIFLLLMVFFAWNTSVSQTGFLPNEDKGSFMAEIRLPDASALQRTEDVLHHATEQLQAIPGVENVIGVSGFSLINFSAIPNSAMLIVKLEHWQDRQDASESQDAIMAKARQVLNSTPESAAFVFATPAIRGMGAVDGFNLVLEDTMGRDAQELAKVSQSFVQQVNELPEVSKAFTIFNANVPQRFVDVDREKAKALGVPLTEIFQTMQAQLGGAYINDFNIFGKSYQVKIQAEAEYRNAEEDIGNLYVRSITGEMVPLSTLVEIKPVFGPDSMMRYNLFNAATVNGYPAPGYTSGDVIKAVEQLANDVLPEGYSYEWSGMTYQEIKAGNAAPIALALSILFTFLFLVAQYESWIIPVSVMMAVPIALMGGVLSMFVMKAPIDLYTQIGMVILIGMSAKVAILIIEFARTLREEKGLSIIEAAVEAARLRFRAVLMTAFAFIMGVYPLVAASGAGAAARHSLGYAVFGGMIISTLIGVTLTPIFFVLMQSLREKLKGKKPEAAKAEQTLTDVAA